MPSASEGLARVYLETQASARLLVASDIPAAREVITDGETGLLFKAGDVDDLTVKTLLAARDPALRARIGRQARERVRAHALEPAVERYLDAIRSFVDQPRSETARPLFQRDSNDATPRRSGFHWAIPP